MKIFATLLTICNSQTKHNNINYNNISCHSQYHLQTTKYKTRLETVRSCSARGGYTGIYALFVKY